MTAGEALPVAVRGAGCRIETADGRSYLDACGGAMVMLLGHCHPRVVEALARQSQQLNYTYRFSFRNEPMLELAERIAGHAPGDLEWSFFNSSGSEANESAMHLAVLYWELMGKPAKIEFLSRVTSYHGSTLGALSLSGSRWRAPFESLLHKYAAVPNAETAEQGAAELEAAILSRGADHVAAFIVEHPDAVPDVITFGTGIGGGVLPLSGMVATRAIREVVGGAPNGFSYGHTFSGYPLGCAVGCAVIDTIEQDGLVAEADRKGAVIRSQLKQMATRHPLMYALRGRGLLQGIELRHPDSGERFAASQRVTGKVTAAARDRGLMIYPCPTPILNQHMDAVMLAPPLVISDDEVTEMLGLLEDSVAAAEATI